MIILSSTTISSQFLIVCVFQLLAECTEQLGLARAASKVYTKDGTTILSLWDLVLWALDKSFIQRDSEGQKEEAAPVGTKETPVKSMEGWLHSTGFS